MTPVAQRVLDYTRDYIADHGWSPSMTEIAETFGFSRPRATELIDALVRDGYLARPSRKHRAITLAGVPDLRAISTPTLRAELARRGVTLDALATPQPINWGRRAVTCAADCCQVEVRIGHLFCRQHWFALPRNLQDGIKRAFGRKDEAEYGRLVTQARDLIDMGVAA